jgi:hypothetical protein
VIVPRVSILLPTRNSCAFLAERLATIFAQTFADWELIVADSFSDDGTWPILQAAAARDGRIELAQTPPDGIYPNWNRCLARARGEFVYVAPSDDTMAPTFLAELVAALDRHPECDLAQCCLHGIDARGTVIPGWWKLIGAARFFGKDYLQPHLRRAPYDGVLHSAMHTIYHSITQVLFRRRVFEKTGPFPETYGPGGDFLWGMKLGLHCDVVHVPEFLATWRMHSSQASHNYRETPEERARMTAMVDAALAARPSHSAAALLPAAPLRFPYRYEYFRLTYAQATGLAARIRVLASLLAEPSIAWRATQLALSGQRRDFNKVDYTRALLRSLSLEQNFVLLPGAPTPPPA